MALEFRQAIMSVAVVAVSTQESQLARHALHVSHGSEPEVSLPTRSPASQFFPPVNSQALDPTCTYEIRSYVRTFADVRKDCTQSFMIYATMGASYMHVGRALLQGRSGPLPLPAPVADQSNNTHAINKLSYQPYSSPTCLAVDSPRIFLPAHLVLTFSTLAQVTSHRHPARHRHHF